MFSQRVLHRIAFSEAMRKLLSGKRLTRSQQTFHNNIRVFSASDDPLFVRIGCRHSN